jgi:hypothetical protein
MRSQWKNVSVDAGSSIDTTPAWWESTWRTVAGAVNSGQYRWTAASSSSAPRSTSNSAQTATNGFETE